MLKYRRLPLLERLKEIEDPKEQFRVRSELFAQISNHEGMQLIAAAFQEIEASAFRALKVNLKPDVQVGRMLAIDQVREVLASHLPEDQQPQWLDEEEAEETFMPPFTYDSGFDIPRDRANDEEPVTE